LKSNVATYHSPGTDEHDFEAMNNCRRSVQQRSLSVRFLKVRSGTWLPASRGLRLRAHGVSSITVATRTPAPNATTEASSYLFVPLLDLVLILSPTKALDCTCHQSATFGTFLVRLPHLDSQLSFPHLMGTLRSLHSNTVPGLSMSSLSVPLRGGLL